MNINNLEYEIKTLKMNTETNRKSIEENCNTKFRVIPEAVNR